MRSSGRLARNKLLVTDRKRHVRSEGIFQHCSLVSVPRGDDKANGRYSGFFFRSLEHGGEAVVFLLCAGT